MSSACESPFHTQADISTTKWLAALIVELVSRWNNNNCMNHITSVVTKVLTSSSSCSSFISSNYPISSVFSFEELKIRQRLTHSFILSLSSSQTAKNMWSGNHDHLVTFGVNPESPGTAKGVTASSSVKGLSPHSKRGRHQTIIIMNNVINNKEKNLSNTLHVI